ncbi:MAG TPA: hypothetical protein VGD49_13030 [Longimicrobiales bacterium]
MTNKSPEQRLYEIYTAFDNLTSANKSLSAESHGTDHKTDKCTVLLMAELDGAHVRLEIFPMGAHLIAQSGSASASVGTANLEDRLTVDLSAGFAWDDATFASPDEMAFYLFKHMRRRLAAISDLNSGSNHV